MGGSSDTLALTLAQEFKKRNNPSNYKELTLAVVKTVEPLQLALANSQIMLSKELKDKFNNR